MHNVITCILLILIISFILLPLIFLSENNLDIRETKRALNLASRAVGVSIEEKKTNLLNMAKGYRGSEQDFIEIDKDRLLFEFYDVLHSNIPADDKFEKIKSSIKAKIIVYYDRFFVADSNDGWSAPYFFTVEKDGRLIYLYSNNNKAYYYDKDGNVKDTDIKALGISEMEKNDIVISKLNEVVGKYTSGQEDARGLSIQILNPANDNAGYIAKNSGFNVLDDITFFVVYKDNFHLEENRYKIKYQNFNVAGYTVKPQF